MRPIIIHKINILILNFLLVTFILGLNSTVYCSGVDQWSREFDGVLDGRRIGLFLGGLEYPTVTFEDIDADGDQDLFLGDYMGKVVFARNIGTPDSAVWHFVTDYYEGIYTILSGGPSWLSTPGVEFVDVDSDEDLDLFCFMPAPYHWENIGNRYEPEWDSLGYLDSLYWTDQGLCFFDADRDGDLDVLSGWTGGYYEGHLLFYRNVGDPQNPFFRLEDTFYDSIELLHYSRPRLADIDADGDDDLFVANGEGMSFFRNVGLPDSADFELEDDTYLHGRAGPFFEFADIDGDEDYDYFAIVDNGCWYFENMGTPEVEDFTYDGIRGTLYFDRGIVSRVMCADIDYDGREEVLHSIGSSCYLFETEGRFPHITWSVTDSNFALPGGRYGYYYDLDADGDLDFLYPNGKYIGYMRNIGDSSYYEWDDSDTLYLYMGYQQTDYCRSLQVIDLDDDGDGDVIAGQWGEVTSWTGLTYFRNIGSPIEPEFEMVTKRFGNLYMQAESLEPVLGDLDLDGDKDLIIRVAKNQVPFEGLLLIYENRGNSASPEFELVIDGLYEVWVDYPCLWDYDEDGDLDCITGGHGGMHLFINENIHTSVAGDEFSSTVIPNNFTLLPNYPNPFNNSTIIPLIINTAHPQILELTIYNMLGEVVNYLGNGFYPSGRNEIVWRGDDSRGNLVSTGIYFYSIKSVNHLDTGKLLLIK